MKRLNFTWAFGLLGIFLLAGCATGRNYQSDIDALNSRISVLQGQLQAKDDEISKLQNQQTEQQAALAQAESEKRLLGEKLDSALSQLEARSHSKSAAKPMDSELK